VIQSGYNSQTLSVALITVSIDADTADKLTQSTVHMPWLLVHAELDGYISATRRPHFSHEVKSANALIAVVDFDADAEQAMETTAHLHQLFFGRIAIVALSSHVDPDLLLRAMRAGANEFLKKPFDATQFSETLNRLDQQWTTTMGRAHTSGHILSFFGAKGGVGTTTIAVHLAMFLVRSSKKKVLLIDNHPELGHVCLYLGLDGNRYHFHELIRNVNRLDSDLLRGFIATHPSGLDVLSSPDAHTGVRDIDPDSIERTLEFLRGEYDYVLLDCETSFADTNLAVMDRSDQIYLIATPEIGAIRDLSRYIDGLVQNEHTTEKLHIAVNRHSSRDAVSIEQIEKAIRLPVEIKICNAYAECVRSINIGEPISADRKTEYAMQFTKWAHALAGPAPEQAEPQQKKKFALWR
jgi:pilus assembly protein CpaE